MDTVMKVFLILLIVTAGYFVVHRLLPATIAAVGRLFGLSMKPTPLTAKRILRFKRIKRGYWSFVAITTAFALSLFLELMVNSRPLYIRYGDKIQMPAVAEWLNAWTPLDLPESARASDFGLVGDAEVDYREFARWVDDPQELIRDADGIEASIAGDEVRFREMSAEAAKRDGDVYDPASPLPAFKVEEYERTRARAARLRSLVPLFSSGDVAIVPALHPFSPTEQILGEFEGAPPHKAFTPGLPLLGTDADGKEVISQLLYAFRTSFLFAVTVAFIGFSIGISIGAIMGYFGGWVDIVVQRIIEIWSSIPFLFTLMIIASIKEPNFLLLAVMLVVLRAWLGITYTIRGEYYREKARDYVQAARAIGVRNAKIMARHIFPNALVPVVTFMPFAIVAYIGTLVSLDYLGFGLPPETPSWGALLRQGRDNISNYPELVLFPILVLSLTLFSVVMIGEAVREAFDPKMYSRLR